MWRKTHSSQILCTGIGMLAISLLAGPEAVAQPAGPYEVRGGININPNNSDNMKFRMDVTSSEHYGTQISRDDLLHPDGWQDPASNTLYEGPATRIVIRPKGGKEHRDLERRLAGSEWSVKPIHGGKTYELHAPDQPMSVRLYNTKRNRNGPMGHWWLELDGERVYFGDEPEDDPDDFGEYDEIVYGINDDTGMLRRYDLSLPMTESRGEAVGTVNEESVGTLTNIQAGAYVPGLQNMFAFWQNPETQITRLSYVDLEDASAAFVGKDLGPGKITGAAMAQTGKGPGGWECLAVQEKAGEDIDFDIEGDTVVTNEKVAARIRVLGTAITMSGRYDIPVTMAARGASNWHFPFGDFYSADDGNLNDGQNPRQWILPDTLEAGEAVDVAARSYIQRGNRWDAHMQVTSSSNSDNLVVLRDGDPVPDIEPFQNQNAIAAYVDEYVDAATGRVELQSNQAIYLFELGTNDTNSAAADFQDLVMLVTLARERETLEDTNASDAVAELVSVNAKSGQKDRVRWLSRQYESLATQDGQTFYATKGDRVFRFERSSGAEYEIGHLDETTLPALAHGGQKLLSFETGEDELMPIEESVRQALGTRDIQMENLGTMVFGEPESDPHGEPEQYD
jgi:hypothetical protein